MRFVPLFVVIMGTFTFDSLFSMKTCNDVETIVQRRHICEGFAGIKTGFTEHLHDVGLRALLDFNQAEAFREEVTFSLMIKRFTETIASPAYRLRGINCVVDFAKRVLTIHFKVLIHHQQTSINGSILINQNAAMDHCKLMSKKAIHDFLQEIKA